MPRNDRACCGCEYNPSCCTSCTDCQVLSQEIDLEFNITPVQFGCVNGTERICDPNLISDWGQGDSVLVPRAYGCNQLGWSRALYSGWQTSCTAYYDGNTGSWPITDDCPYLLCGQQSSFGSYPCIGSNSCGCQQSRSYKAADGICIDGDPAAYCGADAYSGQFISSLQNYHTQNCKDRKRAACCSLSASSTQCGQCLQQADASSECQYPDTRSSMPSTGSGLKRKNNSEVSGTFRFYLERYSDCLESIRIGTNTGSDQYTSAIVGTSNYLVANPQSCENTDPPSPGLTCEQFAVDFFCQICPFCTKEWGQSGYPIQEGVQYMTISGEIDVKNSTAWDPAPLSGASTGDCSYANPPAPDSTSSFRFSALFAPTPTNDDRLEYEQVWSWLETPTQGGGGIDVIYGVGVDFEGTFTI